MAQAEGTYAAETGRRSDWFRRNRITTSPVMVYLCLFILFEPEHIKTIPGLGNAIAYARLALLIIFVVAYLFNKKVNRRLVLYPVLYFCAYAASSAYWGQSLVFVVQKAIPCIGIWTFVQLLVSVNGKRSFSLLGNFFLAMLTVNAVLLAMFPDGLQVVYSEYASYDLHFLGAKNKLLPWLVLASVSCLVAHYQDPSRTSRNRLNLLFPLVLFCAIFEKSSTCILCTLAMIALYALCLRKGSYHRFSVRTAFAISIFFVLLVIVFRVQESMDVFFEYFFGKTSDFSGRTLLWDQAFELIRQSPFIGHGLREESLIVISDRPFTAHNFYLETLCSGGVVALAVFVAMVVHLARRLSPFSRTPAGKVLAIGILLFFFGTLTESGVYNNNWFCLFALAFSYAEMKDGDKSGCAGATTKDRSCQK